MTLPFLTQPRELQGRLEQVVLMHRLALGAF